MSLERYDEAVGELEHALQAAPGYAAAHLNLGEILAHRKQTARATFHLDAALRGGDAAIQREAQETLADILRQMPGDDKEAR
jgi:tetratricopeptide (TPR) repeat protein